MNLPFINNGYCNVLASSNTCYHGVEVSMLLSTFVQTGATYNYSHYSFFFFSQWIILSVERFKKVFNKLLITFSLFVFKKSRESVTFERLWTKKILLGLKTLIHVWIVIITIIMIIITRSSNLLQLKDKMFSLTHKLFGRSCSRAAEGPTCAWPDKYGRNVSWVTTVQCDVNTGG